MVLVCNNSSNLAKCGAGMEGSKAIKMEVVLNEEKSNRAIRKQSKKSEKLESGFEERIRLCCVTMTPGPGTSFADFQAGQNIVQ